MPLFHNRSPRQEEWLPTFVERCEQFLDRVEEAVETFLLSGQGEAFESSIRLTRAAEEAALAARPLLGGRPRPPTTTGLGGHLTGVADATAGMLTAARSLLYALRCQRVVLPPELSEDFAQLLDVNLEACRQVLKRLRSQVAHPNLRMLEDQRMDGLAKESDRLAKAIVFRVFGGPSGAEPGDQLMLRDVVLMTDALSERARRTADLLDMLTPLSSRAGR
ncbi:MAG TPA: hypothetical protein PK668_15005 [Myxococcota bacterium]|nr:hypothetical protein [Myxococcota bacterium]HRY94202.1 hypothetical protein [Myxococcota bacterium]HSA20112.1 hypothetical protein [Myxococcota bacterium]